MPWTVSSVRPLATPLRTRTTPGGQRLRQSSTPPNPNSGIATYQRGLSPAMTGGFNPTIAAEGQSALGQNVNLIQRGMQHRQQFEDARRMDPSTSVLHKVSQRQGLASPSVEGLQQALFERGTDIIQTGGDAGMDSLRNYNPEKRETFYTRRPGFFDTQTPSIASPAGQAQAESIRSLQALNTAYSDKARGEGIDRLNADEQAFQNRYKRLQTVPFTRATRGGQSGWTYEE